MLPARVISGEYTGREGKAILTKSNKNYATFYPKEGIHPHCVVLPIDVLKFEN